MLSMYAKLFSRIAQSSLMEQTVPTRYCFMMLLAIADQNGDVIGTDIAIARSINLPADDFRSCIEALSQPDPDSNSQTFEGRRIIPSEHGRGYHIVNYLAYRAIKTNEEKREYMREYMRERRKSLKSNGVTDVNFCKNQLSDVTHTEGDGEGETEREEKPKKKRAAAAVLEIPEEWSPARKETIAEWIAYKIEKRSPYKPTGWKSFCREADKHTDAVFIPAIQQAMAKNWQGYRIEEPNLFSKPQAAPFSRNTGTTNETGWKNREFCEEDCPF